MTEGLALLITILLALFLDYRFQEPRRYHPLVGFGNLAIWLEKHLNRYRNGAQGDASGKWRGVLAWVLAVLPLTVIACWLMDLLAVNIWLEILLGAAVLYLGVGWQSLLGHARAIARPLGRADMAGARQAVSMIVSRDTSQLDETAIATAATESVLENGADAVFAAIFWFCILGVPGVVLYRLSNTLDAMWGYKNRRYLNFGWAAARADDVLNFIPARLTALSYCLSGKTTAAFKAWNKQRGNWKSPNAGLVMSSGAAAIGVRLGGGAVYHGKWQERPVLGLDHDPQPQAKDIESACRLVNKSILCWYLVIAAMVMAPYFWLSVRLM